MSKNWESKGEWKTDNNVFLFSIDLNKKYKLKNNQKDTYFCYGKCGPNFFQLGFKNFGNLLAKDKCFEYYNIYSVLIQSISATGDVSGAIWLAMGYTVLLCFCLFKTGSMAKAVFSAH